MTVRPCDCLCTWCRYTRTRLLRTRWTTRCVPPCVSSICIVFWLARISIWLVFADIHACACTELTLCQQANNPRANMVDYVAFWFETKYGLAAVAQEAASRLAGGVLSFSRAKNLYCRRVCLAAAHPASTPQAFVVVIASPQGGPSPMCVAPQFARLWRLTSPISDDGCDAYLSLLGRLHAMKGGAGDIVYSTDGLQMLVGSAVHFFTCNTTTSAPRWLSLAASHPPPCPPVVACRWWSDWR